MLRPDPSHPHALHLVQTLAAWARGEAPPYRPLPIFAELAADLRQRPRLVFVLIDGLGVSLLEEHAAPDGVLRQCFARGGELRSVFPSATAAAITTLATARWPAEHAITGWWINEPDEELEFVSLPYVARAGGDPLPEERLPELFPVTTWLPRARRPRRVIQPAYIADSPYSRYLRGADEDWRGYECLDEAVELTLAHCAEETPGYTYLYLPEVDGAAHRHGPSAPETGAVVAEVEAALTRLLDGLPSDARLVGSADHGLVDVPPEGRHALLPDHPLRTYLRGLPSGEPRAPIFHVHRGQQERFAAAFREQLGERFFLLSAAEVEELRLLGPTPLHPRARQRLGDFLAVPRGHDVLFGTERVEEGPTEVRGHHGGLHPDEVRIPLLIGT